MLRDGLPGWRDDLYSMITGMVDSGMKLEQGDGYKVLWYANIDFVSKTLATSVALHQLLSTHYTFCTELYMLCARPSQRGW